MGQPLLVTTDDELAAEVSRLAAVSGCELRHLTEPTHAGDAWRSAPLVLLDEPASQSSIAAELPRRPGIVLITTKPQSGFWRAAFDRGAQQALELPDEQSKLVELFAEAVDASAQVTGKVLAVIGGRGGAGASVLATVTALAAARQGKRCMLLDCDPLGGGLDLAVGAEELAGLRWSGLAISGGRVAARALHEALPGRAVGGGRLTLLSCDRGQRQDRAGEHSQDPPARHSSAAPGMTPQAVQAVIEASRRAGQTVVCDLPRSLDACTVACARAADLTVVVVPAEVRACAATASLVSELPESVGPVNAVVRGPAPGGLKVSDIGKACGLEVLTTMRAQAGLPVAMDKAGLATARLAERGPLARAAFDVLVELDRQNRGSALTLVGAA